MSVKKLEKNSKHLYELDLGHLSLVPVVVSDSKGRYIKQCVDSVQDNIKWYCKSGAESSTALNWVKHNLYKVIAEHGAVCVYIWFGTCDLTVKKGKYIFLSENLELSVSKLKGNLLEIKKFCAEKNTKVIFLEVPYFSIEVWNRNKGHKTPSSFHADDMRLSITVDSINHDITTLNQELGVISPRFNEDLRRSRKSRGKGIRYSFKFSLLQDGVHPSFILAKSWCSSLYRNIKRFCA